MNVDGKIRLIFDRDMTFEDIAKVIAEHSPNHDRRSRSISAGGLDALASKAVSNGGFTWSLYSKIPESGYLLSINPEHEQVIDLSKVAALQEIVQHIAMYLEEKKSFLKASNKFMGAWIDNESGKLHLDISTHVADRQAAYALARQHNQLAVFNVSELKEERV